MFLLCVGFVVWMYEMSKRIGYCMTMRGAVLLVARQVPPEEQSVRSTKCPTICAVFTSVNLYMNWLQFLVYCRTLRKLIMYFFFIKKIKIICRVENETEKKKKKRNKIARHNFCKLTRRVLSRRIWTLSSSVEMDDCQ